MIGTDGSWAAGQQHARVEPPDELVVDWPVDPAPTGLTAAQEIRLRLVELTDWSQCTNSDQFDMQWSNSLHALRALAAWAENGDDETPHLRDWAPACPDPAIHDADLHEAARIADARDQYRVDAEDWRRRTIAAGLKLQNLEAERCPDPALHEEDWVKHKYGQVADANADAAKALGQVAVLEQQLEQIRYERHLLGVARLTLDLVASGAEHGRSPEQIRAEAEDVAQRIVDEIGHPVTDEPALGPSYREQLAALKTELLEAHADLEASLAREQIAAERVERVLGLLRTDTAPISRSIRAILAGDQDEGQRSAAIKAHELAETKADLLFVNGTHHYWSTHCRHGHHDRCAATELAPGVPRNPAQCKTEECQAPCRCECHSDQGEEA